MINPIVNLEDQISIFQYFRGKEYAGNRYDTNLRPERFKHHNGSYVRLKTSQLKETGQPSSFAGMNLLERILFPSYGVTDVQYYGHQSEMLWSYPSAGGSNPVEIYVVIRSLEGITPGIYSYCALHTSLYRVAGTEALPQFNETLLAKDNDADFYFVLTIVPWRSCWKYSYKGYRFSLIDSGHVLTNFQLIIRAMGLEHSVYTAVDTNLLKKLLRLESREEAIAIVAVKDTKGSKHDGNQVSNSNQGTDFDFAMESYHRAHTERLENDAFDWEPIIRFQTRISESLHKPATDWLAQQEMPQEWHTFNQISQLIMERRSISSFLPEELTDSDFRKMILFIRQSNKLCLTYYLIIHAVEGIQPGIYSFNGELTLIKAGLFRELSASLCLGQQFVRQSSLMLFLAIDASQINGLNYYAYQQHLITAGMLGQLVYLKAQEQNLGYSAIGGYYDEEVREQLQIPSYLHVIYAGALGVRDPDGNRQAKRDRYQLQKPQTDEKNSDAELN